MKKGINKEYDEIRNKLFDLRYKIELLKMTPNGKEELEIALNAALLYQNQLKQIEISSIERKK